MCWDSAALMARDYLPDGMENVCLHGRISMFFCNNFGESFQETMDFYCEECDTPEGHANFAEAKECADYAEYCGQAHLVRCIFQLLCNGKFKVWMVKR